MPAQSLILRADSPREMTRLQCVFDCSQCDLPPFGCRRIKRFDENWKPLLWRRLSRRKRRMGRGEKALKDPGCVVAPSFVFGFGEGQQEPGGIAEMLPPNRDLLERPD